VLLKQLIIEFYAGLKISAIEVMNVLKLKLLEGKRNSCSLSHLVQNLYQNEKAFFKMKKQLRKYHY
jgi:hypothetical protein